MIPVIDTHCHIYPEKIAAKAEVMRVRVIR